MKNANIPARIATQSVARPHRYDEHSEGVAGRQAGEWGRTQRIDTKIQYAAFVAISIIRIH